jgi:hypothetical protein
LLKNIPEKYSCALENYLDVSCRRKKYPWALEEYPYITYGKKHPWGKYLAV